MLRFFIAEAGGRAWKLMEAELTEVVVDSRSAWLRTAGMTAFASAPMAPFRDCSTAEAIFRAEHSDE